MFALVLAFALAAPAPPADAPAVGAPPASVPSASDAQVAPTAGALEKLLVLDVAGDGDVAERRGLADAMAALLHERAALDITPASALRDRLTLQADRAESGCDDGSCAAEAADAIGARFVVFSRLTSVSGEYLLRLEAFDGRDARSVSIVTLKGDSIVALSSALAGAVDVMIARSDGALPRREAPVEILEAPGFFERPGNVALVTGGALVGVAALAAVGYGVPAFLMAGRKGDHDRAVERYVDEPNEDNAAEVVATYDRAQQVEGLHTLTGVLALAVPVALIGAVASFVIGGGEKLE